MTCRHLFQGRGFGLLVSALLLLGNPSAPEAQDKVGNGSLTISDGSWGSVYALQLRPKNGNALAESARLVINGGSVSSSIYGGYARSDNAAARAGSNSVIISGGLTGNSPGIYGGYARSSVSATAAANSLNISGSLALGMMASAYGGYARADGGNGGLFMASNNRVNIDGTAHLMQAFGGRISAINGGSDTNAAAYGNMVNVSGGSVDELYGGSATGKGTADASGNTVSISGGTHGHVVGGQAFSSGRDATANDNVISVTGGRITENLIAASVQSDATNASASNNAVYLNNAVVEQSVTGGFSPDTAIPTSLNNNSIVVGAGATVHGAVHGGDAAGTADGNSASYNTIAVVLGGKVDGELVGGNLEKSAGDASHNTILVSDGSVGGDIHGGQTAGGGSASNNAISVLQNGQVGGSLTGGSLQGTGDASNNTILISDGSVGGDIHGGQTAGGGSASNNAISVLQNGQVGGSLTGGSLQGTGDASHNTILIDNGSVGGDIYGGQTAGGGSASNNTIAVVQGGQVGGDLVGGSLQGTGDASHNTILINDGSVGGDIYGGQTAEGGSATGNSIIIGRQATLPTSTRLFGGTAGGSAVAAHGSGNTLFIDNWQGTVDRVAGFGNLHFVLPAPGTAEAGIPMLTVSNAQADDFDGTTVTAQLPDIITGGRAHLGETFELVHDDSLAIAKAHASSLISLQHGYAVLYDGTIVNSNDSIYIRIDGSRPNPRAGALTEARIGAAGLLNQGGDLVAGAALREARSAARQTEGTGWSAFATIYGGTASLTTETDVTTRGLSLVTGLARHAETAWLDVLVGAFFEAGYGSLNTTREVTGTTIQGSGDTRYTGGGLLARIDLMQGLLRGLYVEGSGRAGEVATTWDSEDLLDNLDRPADYDLTTPYYGGHAGLGYRLPMGETWTLDLYGKYLFTHQDGQDTGINGDNIHFDAVDSSRLRLGARLDGSILSSASLYMGAAWEYEYLGTARAASWTSDMGIPSTAMTGSSALFELGLAVTPATAPLRLDLALEGAASTRRSIGGRVQLVYEF